MNSIQKKDIELGEKGEQNTLPLFQDKIDKYLCKTGKFNVMDFISPNNYVEVKTRNCNHDKYDNIMIGKNKVEYALKSFRNCYLAWNFQDGIYYWKVNKEDVDNGDVFYAMGGRCDRGKDERKEVAYVKSHLLTKL